MSTGIARGAPRTAAADIPDAVRIGTMVLILLVILVGPSPFQDRTGTYLIESGAGGNLLTQVLFLTIGGAAGLVILHRGLGVLRPLTTAPAVATLAWFCLTTVTSVDPATSGRRLVSLLIMLMAAAAMLLLARNLRQFALTLGATAAAITAVCYLGLVLAPNLSMHTAGDLTEPEHAGSWRGLFDHKNGAGATMAIFVFVGLFCRSVGYRILGTALAVAAAVFLAFTAAKSSSALMPTVLVLSWLCTLSGAGWWRAAVIVGPVALLLAGTVGTVLVPSIEAVVASVLGSASFTGRTEIWGFALDNIARRPITGYGYGAFWESVFYGGGGEGASWVNAIKSAHNGYLSVALDIGLPGLALTLWWLVLAPLRDLQARGRGIDPLGMLFLRLWLFVLTITVFETALYVPTNGLSFLIALSAFGLRYRATTGLVGARASA
ncbi:MULTISPECIES: O-antigen ligase [unclassified Methylobacterium]|uniref:O-antigen ligase family protein n=1 Tax=unclassified Methylobacterium TaxID=2615210 RepID=UPI0006FA2782|nr:MULTISPECIES: O-antigen ligase [unclassified Methylobacterium]KQP49002.1 hypothetical protein ASF39_14765 [Methylobacterium sp. Leaf108]KQT86872.1 hypothetical protein ASG59_16705 [Methylobacterium sp. Leaf466]